MSKRCHVKYLLFLSNFIEIRIFSTDFRESLKYKVSSKSARRSRSFPCGQISMRKLIVAFRNFANAPTKVLLEGPHKRGGEIIINEQNSHTES